MDALSESDDLVIRYFCSQAHCEESKEEHEMTMIEYNCELARQQSEWQRYQEELASVDREQKITEGVEDCEQKNHELDSNGKDTATATTSATANPGPVKTTAEQTERLKATSSLKEVGSEIDLAALSTTAAAAAGKNGVSLGPIPTNDATAALCSRPGCSVRGTSSCGSCRTTPYCGAKCQTADWPRHKESCEGQLHKLGKAYLVKAKKLYREFDWIEACKYCDLALTKLKRPLDDIAEVWRCKCLAAKDLDRYEECANDIDSISPLSTAAEKGYLTVVQYLVRRGMDQNMTDDDGCSPLHIAARYGHLAVVQYLDEQGADKKKTDNDGFRPLYVAAKYGQISCRARSGQEQGTTTLMLVHSTLQLVTATWQWSNISSNKALTRTRQ